MQRYAHEWVHAETFVEARTVGEERRQQRLKEHTEYHLIVAVHRHKHTMSSDSCYRDTQTHNSENSAPHRFACSNKPLMYKMTSHTVSCQTEGTCTNRRYMEVFTV